MAEKNKKAKLVLASSSPRREEILNQLKLNFTIVPSKINEESYNHQTAEELVQKLSVDKAKSVAELVEDALIIAADTVVVCDDKIIGKPADQEEAKEQLQFLQGREHRVITGLAVYSSDTGESYVAYSSTDVKMLEIGTERIEKYISTGEPMDKAGSYGIQGIGGLFIESINGSYYSVVGLPIHQLAEMLDKFDYSIL